MPGNRTRFYLLEDQWDKMQVVSPPMLSFGISVYFRTHPEAGVFSLFPLGRIRIE